MGCEGVDYFRIGLIVAFCEYGGVMKHWVPQNGGYLEQLSNYATRKNFVTGTKIPHALSFLHCTHASTYSHSKRP